MSDESQKMETQLGPPHISQQIIDTIWMTFWACIIPGFFYVIIGGVSQLASPGSGAAPVSAWGIFSFIVFLPLASFHFFLPCLPAALAFSVAVTFLLWSVRQFSLYFPTALLFGMIILAVEAYYWPVYNGEISATFTGHFLPSQGCGLVVAAAIAYRNNQPKKNV